MHALEFLLNGKRVCVVSPSDDGLILSNVVMTKSLSEEKPDSCAVRFRVGGVRCEQHLEWVSQSLSLGDVLQVRVIDAEQSDPPVSIEPVTDAQRERLSIASRDSMS